MPLSNAEFASILEDTSKFIDGDIIWIVDEDHSPAWQFRSEIESETGWPLLVNGRYNSLADSLSYTLILRTEGRIYGLDLGKDHHNPQCEQTGERHMHLWPEQYRDKEACVPYDITAPISDPVAVWKQFCVKAKIKHNGELKQPSILQQGETFS